MHDRDVSIVILSYNGLNEIQRLLASLKRQTVQPELIIIDSGSTDGTLDFFTKDAIPYKLIPKAEFNHGGTRNLGLDLSSGKYVVFATQDIIFDNANALELLIKPLQENESVAMGFGRQLPHTNATTLATFARLQNYPAGNFIKSKADSERLGIKTPWISNSFSVYKKDILNQLGKFPSHLIMCEDVYAGARAILAGYMIAYVGEARVFHSHNYSLNDEFKRYFDIGYFYNSEKWILESFSKAEGEGLSFVMKEVAFVFSKGKPWLIFEIVARTGIKYLGYQLGKYPKIVPGWMKRMLSMHSYYWKG